MLATRRVGEYNADAGADPSVVDGADAADCDVVAATEVGGTAVFAAFTTLAAWSALSFNLHFLCLAVISGSVGDVLGVRAVACALYDWRPTLMTAFLLCGGKTGSSRDGLDILPGPCAAGAMLRPPVWTAAAV